MIFDLICFVFFPELVRGSTWPPCPQLSTTAWYNNAVPLLAVGLGLRVAAFGLIHAVGRGRRNRPPLRAVLRRWLRRRPAPNPGPRPNPATATDPLLP